MDPVAHTPVRQTLTPARVARPPAPSAAGAPHRPGLDAATLALVLVTVAGIAVRVGLWWEGRAFWRDEMSLVQSLDAYGTGRLLTGPLADAQSAPPLWMLLVRAVTAVAGHGERAYRLVPLVLGCGTLVLLAFLAVRLVRRRWAAVVPLVLVATLSELVFYTAQTKQYTADTFLVTGLLLLGVRLLQDGPTPRRLVGWYAALVVLPWFSHGFLLAAPFVAGWVAVVQLRRGSVSCGGLARGLALPAVSVLAAGWWAWRLTSRVSEFADYWAPFFTPWGKGPRGWFEWHGYVFAELARRELGMVAWWVLALLVAGSAIAARRRLDTAVLLAMPLLAAYVGGLLGVYPFGRRLLLFCVPALLVYLGTLVDGATGLAARRWRLAGPVAGVAALALVAGLAWTTPARLAHDLRYQFGVDDYRSALRFVANRWTDGDVLLVGNGDRAAFRVYGPRVGLPASRAYRAVPTRDKVSRRHCPMPATLAGAARVWVVTGDVVPLYPGESSRYAVATPLLDRFQVVGTRDRGLVTVQAAIPRPAGTGGDRAVRCVDYAPVGLAGSAAFPDGIH